MAIYTIEKEYKIEYEIKKSRFIATLFPVKNLDDALLKLQETRKKYYDATHNCYSYIIKDEDKTIIKASDDGEPSKTAGIVIYDVINKNNLVNVLCIVTRYFGGIKLGANGLVRAYSKASSDVVSAIENKIKIEKLETLKFSLNYSLVNDVLKLMNGYTEVNKEFTSIATFEYLIPSDKIDEIKAELIKLSKNSITFIS